MANMWNTLEEISRDISQIQLEPETEDEKNSTQMKSKVETVKAVPATAEDEKSFSSRRKKNVIRGFKKRISPKSSSSEVKHEAETIDLRVNSGMSVTTSVIYSKILHCTYVMHLITFQFQILIIIM